MPGPTTVAEYLQQIPNPAPCPHSATTSDPPCVPCIERRIKSATALRAGQDPSAVLGLAPTDPAKQAVADEVMARAGVPGQPGVVQVPRDEAVALIEAGIGVPGSIDAATETLLTTEITPSDQAAMEAAVQLPLGEEVNPDDFDDDGFPLPEALRGSKTGMSIEPPPEPQHVTLHSHENAHETLDEAVAQLQANEPPVPEGAFMPGMSALLAGQPDPLTPGMTRTETQDIQPLAPAQAPDPAALLAQMTGGAVAEPEHIATAAPPGVATPAMPPLELTPEQLQRRAEIELGTHPAVAPVDTVPRGHLLGYAQKGYEVNEMIVWPGPPVTTLPVGEPLTTGDALMVDPDTGLVVKYRDTVHAPAPGAPSAPPTAYLKTERNSVGQLYGWTGAVWELIDEPEGLNGHAGGEIDDQGSSARQADSDVQAAMAALHPVTPEAERTPLHPAGHRDALIKYVKAHWPEVTVDKDNVSYVVIDLLASLVVLQALGHEAVTNVLGAEAPLDYVPSPEAVAAADAALQTVTAPPPQPAAAPVAPVAHDDPIAAAAAVAAPVQVAPGELTQHCVHGMPGTDFSTNPPRSASCVDCMNDGGPPPSMSKLRAERFQLAHLETQCARAMCNRTILPGQIIGLVPQVGWCCAVCTKPVRATVPTA